MTVLDKDLNWRKRRYMYVTIKALNTIDTLNVSFNGVNRIHLWSIVHIIFYAYLQGGDVSIIVV